MTITFIAAVLSTVVFGGPPSETALRKNFERFAPMDITADTSKLSKGDAQALSKLIEAARHLDPLYLGQVWSGNPALAKKLAADTSPRGKAVWNLFRQNVGPWYRIDPVSAFVPGVPAHKPATAGFYPADMTKQEFEKWVTTLSALDQARARGFFTLVERGKDGTLELVPYSKAYRAHLEPTAKLLREAAALTDNASLAKFLKLRADALSSDDYYASDVAWMELDAPLDVTLGPYETYEDELFGYKAAFEAYVTLRNEEETGKLAKFSGYLQELEDHLPVDPKYRNPKIGAAAPIRVVDQVFASGEARRGVMTAAFNLPNDERIIKEKGSKRVMLRNVQQAKFDKVLVPISQVVLSAPDRKQVAFAPFFTHILTHELMHGLGPHSLTKNGKETTPRGELKDLYAGIEEAKADITGLWAMQYLMDKKVIDPSLQDKMYVTFLASSFRSVRFGINEAHGKGVALQFNYLTDEGGFAYDEKTGHFRVVPEKIRAAVTKLTGVLLTLEAEGNYAGTKALLDKYAVIRAPMKKALQRLSSVPVDIHPTYPLAGE